MDKWTEFSIMIGPPKDAKMEALGIEQKETARQAKMMMNLHHVSYYLEASLPDGINGTVVVTFMGFEHFLIIPYEEFKSLFETYLAEREEYYEQLRSTDTPVE